MNGNTRLLAVAIAVVIILFPFGYSVVQSVFSQGASLPESPAGEGYCLDDVPRAYMRYHHMDLLKDLRDEVVRYGHGEVEFHAERRKIEFNGCWDCHPSRKEFCNRCHEPVNLYPDCFRCHYDPDRAAVAKGAVLEAHQK